MAEEEQELVDGFFSESAEGFSIANSQPFYPNFIREYEDSDEDGKVISDIKITFNQAYIYNRTSANQVQDRKERAIEGIGMGSDYSLGLEGGEKKFFCEVVIDKDNFLISSAEVIVVEGEDIDKIGTEDGIQTDFPHIIFDGLDEEVGPFTGYFPICTIEDAVLTEYTQRSNIQLSDRQFNQKGLSENNSAHVLITGLSGDEEPEEDSNNGWGYKNENYPVRVRAIKGGSGIVVSEEEQYIVINSYESGTDWSGQNIGGGAEVYDEYSLLPSQFRTLTGEENVEITWTEGGSLVEIKSEDIICGSTSDADWWAYVEDTKRPAKFRGLKAGTGVYFDGDDCVTTISVETGACCTGEKEIEVETIYSHGNHTTFIQFPPDNPNSQKFVVNDIPVMEMDSLGGLSLGDVSDNCITVKTYGHTEEYNWSNGNKYSETNKDSNGDGQHTTFDRNAVKSTEVGSNADKEGSVKTYNIAGTQITNEMSADGAGNAVQTQKNSAGTIVNQTAADASTDTYFNAGPVGLGTSEPSAGYAVDVKGTAKVFSSSTPANGLIQLGTATNQTMGVVGASSNFVYGAGVSSFSSDSDETLDVFTTNSAGYSAVDAYIIGSSPATGSAIMAGSGNSISGHFNAITAGANNLISGKSMNFIGGGSGIDIINSEFSVSVGGRNNDVKNSNFSVIGGGFDNLVSGGGGRNVIGGGYDNEIHGASASNIAGGYQNIISGNYSSTAIAGGTQNKAYDTYCFIGAGASHTIHNGGNGAVIVGGAGNIISGTASFIGGGINSYVSGSHAVALGNYSRVSEGHNGAFVFTDSVTTPVFSKGADTMHLKFKSGVYITTDSGIYINGNAVLTGETPEGDTLQTVTSRGNLTTTDIISEGEISGASGVFNSTVGIGTAASYVNAPLTVDGDGGTSAEFRGGALKVRYVGTEGTISIGHVGAEGRIVASKPNWGQAYPLKVAGDYVRICTSGASADTEVIRFTADGDVGIGTTNPDTKLHLQSGRLTIAGNGSEAIKVTNSDIVNFDLSTVRADLFRASAVSDQLEFRGGSNRTRLLNSDGGTELFTITNSGDVGIGVSDPDATLEIQNGTTSAAVYGLNINDMFKVRSDGVIYWGSAYSYGYQSWTTNKAIVGGLGGRDLGLHADGAEKITIKTDGKVGIGTTDPNQLLHVDGKTQLGTNGFTEGGLLINYASLSETKGGASTLLGNAVYAGTTNNTFRRTKGDAGNYITLNYNKGITFHTNVTGNTSDDYDINNHEQMRITTGGFVGIGITSPSQLLNISGGHILIDHQDPQLMFNDIGGSTHTASWMYQNNSMDFVWGGGKKFTIDSAGGVTLGQEYSTGYSAPSKGMIMEGNLGIGTNAPSHKLNVAVSDGDDGIVLQKAGSSNDIFRVTMDGTSDQGEIFLYDGGVCEFAIRANTNFSYINTPANFGIGTTSPARKLEVSEGSSSIVSQFKSTAGTSAYITLANTTSTADKIRFGSIGNDLILSSNYTDPDIYIEAGGKVGIGTDNPSSKLHVNAGSLEITSGSHVMTNNYSITWGTGQASKIYAGDGVHDMAFTAGSSLAMIINGSSQNVGIGTNAPAYKLDIQAAAAEIAQIKRTNGGNCEFLINPVGGDAKVVFQNSGTDIWAIGKDNSDSSFRISEGGALETNPRFTVDNGGNVGIGTTNPAKKLTVYHAGNAQASITGTNVAILTISDPNSHGQLNTYNDGTFRINSQADAGGTQLVLSGSNVGVGTAFPSYKLDVNGTIHGTSGNFEDGITVNGNPVLTGTSAYETDTLQTVTDDGNTTTNSIYINGSGDDVNYAPLNVSGANTLAFFRGTSTYAYLQFQNSTTSYGSVSNNGLTIGNNGNDAYVFQREAAPLYFGTSGEARMTILGDSATHSKVGIGTITPASTAGSDSFLEIYGATDAGLVISSNNGEWDLKNTNPTANLSLFAAGSHRVTFAYAGNVGIGSATPSEKLDVNGSIILRGSTNHRYKVANDSNNNWAEIGNDGASSENTLEFFTKSSSVPAMSITNDDRVGIGTTNPSHKLHVKTSGAGDWITRIDNTSSSSSYGLKVGAGTDSSDIGFEVANYNGDIGLRVQGNSHVGIGTTSADAFLNIYNTGTTSSSADVHIVGSGNTHGLLYERLRNDSLIVSKSTTAGSYFKTDSATSSFQGYEIGTNWFLGQYGYNDFRITDGTKSGGTAALTIQDSTQNVGIGVTNPTNKLEIWGQDIRLRASTVDARLTLSASDSVVNNSILNFGDNDSSSIGQIKYAHSGDSMRFQTNSSEAMRIDSSGYVGIGTSSPSYELDVNGTTRSTYYIGGAYLEENVSSSKLKFYTDGTVLVMDEDGSLKPCEEENDTLVFGVSKKDFDQPVVLGAEPVLVTGPIKVGDYIVTSSKQGHGQAMKEEKLGTIIAQAMENGDGESHNIKAMVRKM